MAHSVQPSTRSSPRCQPCFFILTTDLHASRRTSTVELLWTSRTYITQAYLHSSMANVGLLGLLGRRNQDRLLEVHRREVHHARPIRSSYTTPHTRSTRTPLRNHRAGSSPSEARKSLGSSQLNVHNNEWKSSSPSMVGLTYGLPSDHNVLRAWCLHGLLLLRWVDFRHFIQWVCNA